MALCAQITPHEAISAMKHGINLGNVLEAPQEGNWAPPAREAYFDLYVEAGFDLVRIPVRWDQHTGNQAPYAINSRFMDRVEEVVDWGLERDLFVVLNSHHDNWIKEDYENPSYRARFDSIWSQVATRFMDKPEKLIFEVLNEPKGLTKAQNDEMHERILGIIRRNNPTRNVIVQGNEWGGADQLVSMKIPDDPFIIGSFHSYDPWPFGLEGSGSFGSSYDRNKLEEKFLKVKAWSDTSMIPVFLGEFACHMSADYNSRMNHYRAYVDFSQRYGFTPVTWDCASGFQAMDRSKLKWRDVKEVLIHSGPFAPYIRSLKLEEDTLVTILWRDGEKEALGFALQRKSGTDSWVTLASLDRGVYSFTDSTAEDGQDHCYRIIGTYVGDSTGHAHPQLIHMPAYVPQVRGYFLGEAHQLPGTVEAEDFDLGGEGLSYHERDQSNLAGAYRPEEAVDIYAIGNSAYHVGNILPGEWTEYSLSVMESGTYQLDVQCAAFTSGGSFQVDIAGQSLVIDRVEASGTLTTTRSQILTCSLDEGEELMRFTAISEPAFNVDKFIFTREAETTGIRIKGSSGLKTWQDAARNLVIQLPEADRAQRIQLYRLSGQLVKLQTDAGHQSRLPCQDLDSGIYLLGVEGNENTYHQKIYLH